MKAKPGHQAQDVARQLGKRLRELRLATNLSQWDAAERMGLSVSFISLVERGKRLPHVRTLAKIAAALDVPLVEVFRFDPDDSGR